MPPLILDGSSLQQVYNAQRLPLLWTGVSQICDNALSSDQLLAHPSFQAINAFLAEKDEARLDHMSIAQAGLEYAKLPEEERAARHPILTRDLSFRSEPIREFDIGSIPEGPYREAMHSLIQVVGLADLYYRLQVEPAYIHQLKKVIASGDIVRIHHYWLRGRLGDINPEVSQGETPRIVLPGEKRTHNGVWWPSEFGETDIKELQERKWKDPILKAKVFSPLSRIVAADDDEPDIFEHRGFYYKPVSLRTVPDLQLVGDMMAARLRTAAEILEQVNAPYAEMLRGRARHVTSDDLFKSVEESTLWVEAGDTSLAFFVGLEEVYVEQGSPFGTKALMKATLGFQNDPTQRQFVEGIVSVGDQAHQRLIALWSRAHEEPSFRKEPPRLPHVDVTNVVFNAAQANTTDGATAGHSLPNDEGFAPGVVTSELPRRLQLFGHMLQSRITNEGLPIARRVFDNTTVAALEEVLRNPRAIITFTNAHEIAHGRGVKPAVPLVPSGKLPSELYGAGIAGGFEEGKADLIGIFDLPFYVERGTLTADDMRAALYAYLGNTLRNLMKGETTTHGRGSIYNWWFLLHHEAVKLVGDRYHFSPERLVERAPDMVYGYLSVYGSEDPEYVERFHTQQAMPTIAQGSLIRSALENVKATDSARGDRAYYVMDGFRGFG